MLICEISIRVTTPRSILHSKNRRSKLDISLVLPIKVSHIISIQLLVLLWLSYGALFQLINNHP